MTAPLYALTDTWNNGATVFTAILMNVTNTASAANSKLIDLQIGGVSTFNVDKGGFWALGAGDGATAPDAFNYREAANIIAQRNGTSAQTSRVYNTFTDSSNFERTTIDWNTTTNVCYLRNEAQGSGSARLLVYRSGATTVAGLPSASTAGSGARSFVTDANATTFLTTVAAGGSNKVPVVSDGTNWLIG